MAGSVGSEVDVNLELPYDPSGKINWTTLGNILTAKILGEVVCASHVDKGRSNGHSNGDLERSYRADTEWEYCYEEDRVAVLKKKRHRTCMMGRGVINKPLSVIAEFIKDIQTTFIWDNLLVEARYVKVLTESRDSSDYIAYQLFETIQRCGLINIRRDLLYYVRCAYVLYNLVKLATDKTLDFYYTVDNKCKGFSHFITPLPDDGKYVQTGVSIEDPDYPPRPNMPRITMHMGTGFVAEPYNNDPEKTLLNYLVHVDTKGIPSIVNTQILKRHPMAISRLRRNLEERTSISSPLSSPSTSPFHFSRSESTRYEDGMQVEHFMRENPYPGR